MQDLANSTPTTTKDSETPHLGHKILDGLLSRVGRRYSAATFKAYKTDQPGQKEAVAALKDYAKSWPNRESHGCGIVLYGPRGTGKDHLLVATAGYILTSHAPTTEWIDGQELFSLMRDQIGSDVSEAATIRRWSNPDLLIISDPYGQGENSTITEFQQSTLWRIIDRRYREMKPTWVSMNAKDSAEMSRRLGPQLTDRLLHGALVVHCNWPSYRQPETIVK